MYEFHAMQRETDNVGQFDVFAIQWQRAQSSITSTGAGCPNAQSVEPSLKLLRTYVESDNDKEPASASRTAVKPLMNVKWFTTSLKELCRDAEGQPADMPKKRTWTTPK